MRNNKYLALLLGGLMVMSVVACEHKGPAERAGEKIDDAAKDVKQGAQDAANKVEDAAQDVKDKVEDKK